MTRLRWSRKVMLLNICLMYSLVLLGGYILWEKARFVFLVYLFIWTGILIIGRYFVCCRCSYYGQYCPSFGFSYIARLLFPKNETQEFSARACIVDTSIIVGVLFFPIIVWLISFFGKIEAFSATQHILMVIYLLLAITVERVHEKTGCSKCDVKQCPMSKAAKTAR